jgi:hypothetical protein
MLAPLNPAFSKKIENHAHSVALHYMHYNFCCIQDASRDSRDGCWHDRPGFGRLVILSRSRRAGNMLNPFKWKPEHRVGLLIASAAGAALSVGIGYAFSHPRLGYRLSFIEWIEYFPGDALFWPLIGAFVVGAAIYCYRIFSN